jgi:hypothetical protein
MFAPRTPPASATADWIVAENLLPGTTDWKIPTLTPRGIVGFADRISGVAGDEVRLFVDTKAATFSLVAYRLGWYQGQGGRELWRSDGIVATDQPDPTVDLTTNTVETAWTPSTTITVDPTWPPGVYLFEMITPKGGKGVVPFVLRDDASTSDLLYQLPTITWQAYNGWGGYDLYEGADGQFESRSRVVSYDRPFSGRGWGGVLHALPFIVQAERDGSDVSYWTDLDLHARPGLLLQHHALISLDHDEYWSTAMRDGLKLARNRGVNAAFLGANAIYRHVRVEPSPLGADRRIVNYKRAQEDPLFGVDSAEVTSDWRRFPVPRPESALMGAQYACNPARGPMTIPDADIWPFAGTGLVDGDSIPGAIDMEFDKVFPDAPTPASIEVLAHSPIGCRSALWFHDMTYYTTSKGAGVVDVGSQGWGNLLMCSEPTLDTTTCDTRALAITRNILDGLAAGPSGLLRPSVPNAASYGYVLTKPLTP